VYQIGKTLTSGATYVFSALVKYSAGSGWVGVMPYNTSSTGTHSAWFDLQNGVVGSKDTNIIDYGMIDYGDGWWLCWASKNAGSTSGGASLEVVNANGSFDRSAADTLLIAGSQIEAGAFPTSYIPTTGSAPATRAKDIAEIPTSAFGYNNDKGTVVCEFDSASRNGSTIFTLVVGQATDGITAIIYPANRVSYQVVTGGAVQVNLNFDAYATASQVSKVATVYAKDDFAAVLNGGAVATDTAGSVPLVSTLKLGVYWGGGNFFMSGHIKSIQYYPRRLTNTQLQELTT
jgi:hypothetical protein